jgi:hypothetical protein
MGGVLGISSASSKNYTSINNAITQQYSGSCDFSCNNSIKNTNIDIVNSTVEGGINLENACSIDGVCSISSSMDAVSDILYKASQSTNASAPGILSIEVSESDTITHVSQAIDQSVMEQCNVQASNDIVNTQIFAANSNISGGINIKNNAQVKGNCVLSNVMKAMESASLTIDQVSAAGKKVGKCGNCGGWEIAAIYVAIGIAVILGLVGVAYAIKKWKDSHPDSSLFGMGSKTSKLSLLSKV